MKIYVYRDGQVEGPFDDLVIQQALANGTMSPDQLCCQEGSKEWVAASSLFQKPRPSLPTILKPMPIEFLNRAIVSKISRFLAIALPRFVKIGLIAVGGFVGILFCLCILGAIFGSDGPTPSSTPAQVTGKSLTQDRLNEVNRKIDELDNEMNEIGMRLITMSNQADQVKASGQTLTPASERELVTAITQLATMGETLDRQKKTLESEREDLRRQLAH